MSCCIVCGNRCLEQSNHKEIDQVSKLSIARFAVQIFLELGDLSQDCLSIDKLCTWWTTCDLCSELFQESFEIYRQLVKLSKQLLRNRQEVVDKCQSFCVHKDGFRNDNHQMLHDSEDPTSQSVKQFRKAAIKCSSQQDIISIRLSVYEGFLEEEVAVKEEEQSEQEETEDIRNRKEFSYDLIKEENTTSEDEEREDAISETGFSSDTSDGENPLGKEDVISNEHNDKVPDRRSKSSSASPAAPDNLDSPPKTKRPRGRPRKSEEEKLQTRLAREARKRIRDLHRNQGRLKKPKEERPVKKPVIKPVRKLGRPRKPEKAEVNVKPPKAKDPFDDLMRRNPDTKRYHCPDCHYVVDKRSRLVFHYRTIHLKEDPAIVRPLIPCSWPNCEREFTKKENYARHMEKHEGAPRYQCTQCPQRFYTRNVYSRHVEREHKGGKTNRPYICELCGKGYAIRDYLYNHKYTVHSSTYKGPKKQKLKAKEKVICESCGKSISAVYIAYHMKNVHGIGEAEIPVDTEVCDLCGKTLKKVNMKLHMWNIHRQKSDDFSWACHVCQYAFHSKSGLDVHLYSKHKIGEKVTPKTPVRKWQCDVQGCRKLCNSEDKLKAHMEEIHGPDRTKPGKFECRFCGKRFFIQCKHEHHEMSHQNAESKPFTCETCGKGFPTPAYLRYHLVHTHKVQVENRQGFKHLGVGQSSTIQPQNQPQC